ncbi:phage tail tip lysozyme [Candidatus Saccharibacteria bacterium]|nr:phage tail tip lysozyme [Candidatus Saccharibacteria bacterium]
MDDENDICPPQSGGMGRVVVTGDTAEEMIWSGLVSFGFTPAQAAGIMGNIAGESAGNPVRHEQALMNSHWNNGNFNLFANANISYGIGLVQWSFGRRVSFMNHIQASNDGLLYYFKNPEIYSQGAPSGNQFITRVLERGRSINDVRELVALNLEFVIYEMGNRIPRSGNSPPGTPSVFPTGSSELEVMKQITTLELASEFFLFSFERPASVNTANGATFTSYWNSANRRAGYAQRYYDQFAGMSIGGGGGSAGGSGGGGQGSVGGVEGPGNVRDMESESVPCDPRTTDIGVRTVAGHRVRLCMLDRSDINAHIDAVRNFGDHSNFGWEHPVVNSRASEVFASMVQAMREDGISPESTSSFRAGGGGSFHDWGLAIDFQMRDDNGAPLNTLGNCLNEPRDTGSGVLCRPRNHPNNAQYNWLSDNSCNFGIHQLDFEHWHFDTGTDSWRVTECSGNRRSFDPCRGNFTSGENFLSHMGSTGDGDVLIVAGHVFGARGRAHLHRPDGYSEEVEARNLASDLQKALAAIGITSDIANVLMVESGMGENMSSYMASMLTNNTPDYSWVPHDRVLSWNVDPFLHWRNTNNTFRWGDYQLVIEIHFNAPGAACNTIACWNATNRAVIVNHPGSPLTPASRAIGSAILDAIVETTDTPRGNPYAVDVAVGTVRFFNEQAVPVVYLETLFYTSMPAMDNFTANRGAVAEAMARAIANERGRNW